MDVIRTVISTTNGSVATTMLTAIQPDTSVPGGLSDALSPKTASKATQLTLDSSAKRTEHLPST